MYSGVCSNMSVLEDNLWFYFVASDDGILSEDMFNAKQRLSESVIKDNIHDVSEEECIEMAKSDLEKRYIFIFKAFEGAAFKAINAAVKPLIMGPRCLYSCLIDNITVPNNRSPIFTLGMRDLIVCMSALPIEKKRELEVLVGYMGGKCTQKFTDDVTHLITENVMTKKYEVAVLNNKLVMRPDWVRDVWNSSRNDNILGTAEKFDRHRLPVFNNLGFSSSGLAPKFKNEIQALIEKHGGRYYGSFSTRNVDVLILEAAKAGTEKHSGAEKAKKECLTPEWILDSVKKGYAVPIEAYRVPPITAKVVSSTPEKSGDAIFSDSNLSMMSRIGMDTALSINETLLSNVSTISVAGPSRRDTSMAPPTSTAAKEVPYYKEIFDSLNIQDAKKAGTFLDGCNIYICGFTAEEKDRIYKILNSGGATRFDTIHSNISHVIVGVPNKSELSLLTAKRTDAPILKLNWLVESIAKKQPVPENEALMYRLKSTKSADLDVQDAPSPASKKNILSMSGSASVFKVPRRKLGFNDCGPEDSPNAPNNGQDNDKADDVEDIMLDQYLAADAQPGVPLPAKEVIAKAPTPTAVDRTTQAPAANSSSESKAFDSEMSSQYTENPDFLINTTVCIHGFDRESTDILVYDCKLAGAEVVQAGELRSVNYLITSMDVMALEGITVDAEHLVNQNWLMSSKKYNKIQEIEYFYKPIIFSEEKKPLASMIIVLSTYSGEEREFLVQLAEALGADVQDTYKKSSRPLLICPTPDNAKYTAAIKWNLPVVTRDWLLQCYVKEKRLPVKNFLVGLSISPVEDIVDDEESEPEDFLLPIPNMIRDEPIAGPSHLHTPILRHNRVAQLQGSVPKSAHKSSPARADDNVEFQFPSVEQLSQDLDLRTPERTVYIEFLKEREEELRNETPNSKRRRLDMEAELNTLSTPEVMERVSTPYMLRNMQKKKPVYENHERRQAAREKAAPAPVPAPSTPWSVYKRKFWQHALGDKYESPSQCHTINTQSLLATEAEPAPVMSTAEIEEDEHVRRLNEFIENKNRHSENEAPIADNGFSQESAPYRSESDFPSTENDVVDWRDPTEICQTPGARRPALIQKNRPHAMNFRGTPHFIVSCDNSEEQLRIYDRIKKLGGIVCTEAQKQEIRYTHFICEKPNRGQNTFTCIASGKWYLHLEYIKDSDAAGYFLDEELYEWGNPKAKNEKVLEPNIMDMANAAYRWRNKLQANPGEIPKTGAFKDFRVILKTPKVDSLKILIESAGGKVILAAEPYHTNPQAMEATHFVGSKLPQSEDDRRAFRKKKIACVSMMFLNAWITSPKPADPEKYALK